MYYKVNLTLSCIFTSIFLLDSNSETITVYPLADAHISAVQPSFIRHTHYIHN